MDRVQTCIDLFLRLGGALWKKLCFYKTCGWQIAAGVRGVNPISGSNVAMDPDRASSNYHSLPHRISTTNICEGLTFGPNVAIRSPSLANCPHHLSCHFLTASDTPQMYQYAGELGLGWWLKSITGALKTVRLLGQDRNSQDKSRLTNMCTCKNITGYQRDL